MNQLIFEFPFKKKYYEQDFYVSSNNFSAYKLIESWPNWTGNWLNIFGSPGSGKTHLSKILEKKINNVMLLSEKDINDKIVQKSNQFTCMIIDNFENIIDEKLFYSLLNQSNQLNNYIVINSQKSQFFSYIHVRLYFKETIFPVFYASYFLSL